MPRGAKPGQRRGGRAKGTPNKATIEKAIIAEQIVTRATMEGRKLAKEVLDEFMTVFAGMAATHQPLPPGTPIPPGRHPDLDKFEKYARLTVETAARLAPYQSPTFKAITVIAPPSQPPQQLPGSGNVISIDDPDALARVYRMRVGGVKG